MQEELAKLYKAAPLYRELFDKQLEFALSPNRFLGALCTRRVGKTTVCAVKALNELATNPNKLGMYLALTDESVKDKVSEIRPLWIILTDAIGRIWHPSQP